MNLIRRFLVARDGAVTRFGPAMLALAAKTGYSVEALRSFAYGRRIPRDEDKRTAKLLREVEYG